MAKMTRDFQFTAIEHARQRTLAWAKTEGIPLHTIEFVVPFVEDDFSLAVWLFFDADADLTSVQRDGRYATVEEKFSEALAAEEYPSEWLAHIAYYGDSHENVERNYEGSYFYRLR